jgi:hypothetical protein
MEDFVRKKREGREKDKQDVVFAFFALFADLRLAS